MTCEQARHHLGGYVLGGLSPAEQANTRAHLQRCGDCRNDLSELEGLPRLLDLVVQEPAQPPPSLRDRVVAAGPIPGRSGGWPSPRPHWVDRGCCGAERRAGTRAATRQPDAGAGQ